MSEDPWAYEKAIEAVAAKYDRPATPAYIAILATYNISAYDLERILEDRALRRYEA